MVLAGIVGGALNGLAVTGLGIKPFVVTLSTLYIGRGFALWLTETRALNLPDSLLAVGSARLAGVPVPVVALVLVLVGAHLTLQRTPPLAATSTRWAPTPRRRAGPGCR